MQLAPSIRRLGTSSLVNTYLVEHQDGITVVDAGLPGHWTDLQRELAAIGRPIAEVRALLLTHADVDHVGFAERLRREAGVAVYVGAGDAPRARGEGGGKSAATRDPIRLGPALGFFAFGLTHGGLRSTPIARVSPVAGRTTLDVPGSPEVIPLPGHTPGSVAYRFGADGAIFMGDAMTTRSVVSGVVGPALGPFTVDPARALASLDVLDGVEADLVLPGHGDAWTGGLAEAIRAIRASEARRAA